MSELELKAGEQYNSWWRILIPNTQEESVSSELVNPLQCSDFGLIVVILLPFSFLSFFSGCWWVEFYISGRRYSLILSGVISLKLFLSFSSWFQPNLILSNLNLLFCWFTKIQSLQHPKVGNTRDGLACRNPSRFPSLKMRFRNMCSRAQWRQWCWSLLLSPSFFFFS